MKGDRTHLEPPTPCVKKSQQKYFSAQILTQLRENALRDKAVIERLQTYVFWFKPNKG